MDHLLFAHLFEYCDDYAIEINCTMHLLILSFFSSSMTSKDHQVLKVKKLSKHATLPTRGSQKSAGLDLYSAEVLCSM